MDLPIPRKTYQDTKIAHQQGEVGDNSCTVHAAMGCVTDNTGLDWTLSQRKEVWAEAKKRGADPKWGWYINKTTDLVGNRQRCILELILERLFFALDSDEAMDALDKGYSLNAGFRETQHIQRTK